MLNLHYLRDWLLRKHDRRTDPERGQVLVIVGVGMILFVLMVGLVVDGGHAWGEQRDTQNASDAAAEAGALKLAENLSFKACQDNPAQCNNLTPPAPNGNAEVRAAVIAAASGRHVTVEEAWYTDYFGARVGGSPLIGSAPLAGGPAPTDAEGVEVTGVKTFDTYIAKVIGMNQMTARTPAVAVSGYIDKVGRGNVLPVTIPVNVTTCSNTNGVQNGGAAWPLNQPQIVPLCSSGPGNVGWLDWEPPHGGTSELADAILHPNNPELAIPGWYFVAETGNVSASQVQDALMTYAPGNQEVIIPLFDATCADEPPDATRTACTTGPGTGQNEWYHLAGWVSFDLEWVDLNGGARVCGSGNGSTGCMQGEFRSATYDGTIRRAGPGESVLSLTGIKLIR
jgi:hypothetical protein